jgi:fructose-1,6-bisphosphatase/inositol monophosphatase family enzyme
MVISDKAIDRWLAFTGVLADTAHGMLAAAGRVRPEATVKPDRTFVTPLDAEIEERLRGLIEARYPAHGILGEEGDAVGASMRSACGCSTRSTAPHRSSRASLCMAR